MINIGCTLSTLALVLMLSACSTVEPWERGALAKPQMASDPHPLQSSLSTHVYNSREAASGGNSAGGGGCGCY
ncbi:MAG: DUF4266 domain-containing protein [Gammaproteobacteria bacterium]|nr:DUF4266 domain-containing protein [Gammaproteobacteria bacterium]